MEINKKKTKIEKWRKTRILSKIKNRKTLPRLSDEDIAALLMNTVSCPDPEWARASSKWPKKIRSILNAKKTADDMMKTCKNALILSRNSRNMPTNCPATMSGMGGPLNMQVVLLKMILHQNLLYWIMLSLE
jgi:hypothetical protein